MRYKKITLGYALSKGMNYTLMAAILFLLGAVIGYLVYVSAPSILEPFVEGVIDNLLIRIEGLEDVQVSLWSLIQNNIFSAVLMVFAGIVLVIPTIFLLVQNGAVLGIVMAMLLERGYDFTYMAASILPHGVVEFIALFLAGGMGLKFGTELFKPEEGLTTYENFKDNFRASLWILFVIVALLLIAAVIEIYITPSIMAQIGV